MRWGSFFAFSSPVFKGPRFPFIGLVFNCVFSFKAPQVCLEESKVAGELGKLAFKGF